MEIAPKFELAKLGGGRTSLDALLQQSAVLLVFFKISCPVCQLALPYLNRMKSGALRIVAISQDDAESTVEFHEAFQVSLETLLDSEDEGYPASNDYGIAHVPAMFLIEQDGTVSNEMNGFAKREMEALGARCGIAPFGPEDSVPAWKAG